MTRRLWLVYLVMVVALGAGMVVVGERQGIELERAALERTTASVTALAQAFAHEHIETADFQSPDLKRLAAVFEDAIAKDEIFRRLLGPSLMRTKVWDRNYRVIYSDDISAIGRTFPQSPELQGAYSGNVETEIDSPAKPDNEGQTHPSRVLETYVPVVRDGQVVGVIETYTSLAAVDAGIQQQQRTLFLGLGASALFGAVSFGLLIRWIQRLVVRPIRRLQEHAHRIGQQGFRPVPEDEGSPEVRGLARSLNSAAECLGNLIGGLERANQELRRTQNQLVHTEKLSAIGQLAGGVAHELNNPLQAIVAYAALNAEKAKAIASRLHEPEMEGIARNAIAVQEAAERSAKIVRGLLSFARKDGVSRTTVDLNDLVRSTAELLNHTLGLQKVGIELDLGPGPLQVRGNPVALQQALTNLLLNAKDATPGGGTVALRTRRENGSVEVAVADAGTGMAPEVQAHLFEPFFTTKPPGKGTGLGLSVTYGIVKEHGGSIEAESEPGKGSTFTIRLPAMAGPGPAGTPGVAEARP